MCEGERERGVCEGEGSVSGRHIQNMTIKGSS